MAAKKPEGSFRPTPAENEAVQFHRPFSGQPANACFNILAPAEREELQRFQEGMALRTPEVLAAFHILKLLHSR